MERAVNCANNQPKGLPPHSYFAIAGVLLMIFTYITEYSQPLYSILWIIAVLMFTYGVFNE